MSVQKTILNYFDLSPTAEQANALNMVEQFVDSRDTNDFLIINGAAGTGKSTMIKAFTDYFTDHEINFNLSAPTAKAAKIIQKKTKRSAGTIHSKIYIPEYLKNRPGVKMIRKDNLSATRTIFIIDEASMISDIISNSNNFISTEPLLTDMISFIKQGNTKNKMIFIGDSFQLRPIKSIDSPALSVNYLETQKKLKGNKANLRIVKRQRGDSYILDIAEKIKNSIENNTNFNGINGKKITDTNAAVNKYLTLYNSEAFSNVTFIAWTNESVNELNNSVRKKLGFGSNTLAIGDQVTLDVNWYGNSRYIMKGDTGIIRELDNSIEIYEGLKFMNAKIEFRDTLGEPYNITLKVMLDSLSDIKDNILYEKEKNIFSMAMKTNEKFRESMMPYDDPYVGAMKLRYNYATTCHKAQGGEWENVILHPKVPRNDYRWQYTAVTRASKELYTLAA